MYSIGISLTAEKDISPSDGDKLPVNTLSKVDLPEPFGPRMA